MRTFQARLVRRRRRAANPPNAPTPNAKLQDEFISGTSAAYLESLEDKFREDPNSVPASWAAFLRQMGASRDPGPISRHPHERIARGNVPRPRAPRPPSPHPQKVTSRGRILKRAEVKWNSADSTDVWLSSPGFSPPLTHQTPA